MEEKTNQTQKEKNQHKREQIEKQKQELLARIESGIKDVVSSDAFRDYLKFVSKFHHYSLNNSLLIFLQNPDATLVAGYSAWQKNFKRQVKRGEKGISILRPQKVQRDVLDENGAPVLDDDGNPMKKEYLRFYPAKVFDVGQTFGEPLPEFPIATLTDDVKGYNDFMKALTAISKYPIAFEDISGKGNGYFSRSEQRIVVRKDLPPLQTVKTTIHELAHSFLHDGDVEKLPSKECREIEAETTAFIVTDHFGMDCSQYTFPYLASWSTMDFKDLHASFQKCIKQADKLINGIEKELRELQKEKTQDKVADKTVESTSKEAADTPAQPTPSESQPAQRDTVYLQSRVYAAEHGEEAEYRASMDRNVACAKAIEAAVEDHYSNYSLDSKAAVKEVVAEFGEDRVCFVLANTVRQKSWDGRIDQANKDWAATMPACPADDAPSIVVDRCNPGLVNLFLNEVRQNLPVPSQQQTMPEKQAEPEQQAVAAQEKKAKLATLDELAASATKRSAERNQQSAPEAEHTAGRSHDAP